MRILVAHWTRRQVGGAERYVDGVLRGLHDAGHRVALLCERDVPTYAAPVWLPDDAPRWSTEAAPSERVLGEVRRWAPDVVYSNGLESPSLERALAVVAPLATSVHSYRGTCISGSRCHLSPAPVACDRTFGPGCLALYLPRRCGGRSPLTMVRKYREERARLGALRQSDLVITHSEHMRTEYERHGIARERLRIVPLALPGGDHPFDVAPAPASDRVELLYVGRLERVKGVDLLLHAAPLVQRALGRPMNVRILGEGPLRTECDELARALAGEELDIDLRGWVGAAGVIDAYRSAHLLVVPSIWPEPFGMVGLEAARHGLPSVAFAVGGIPEWLADGASGHLVRATPPSAAALADGIVAALRDPAHHAELRAGAVNAARRYAGARWLELLVEALDAARRTREVATADRGRTARRADLDPSKGRG